MRIFFDTEFTGLTADAKLISIGLIDESGENEFYSELADTYDILDCSVFCRREVLPNLRVDARGQRWTMCGQNSLYGSRLAAQAPYWFVIRSGTLFSSDKSCQKDCRRAFRSRSWAGGGISSGVF